MWTPKRGVTVDDIVGEVPAGGLVRLDTQTPQGIILVSPADHETWETEHAPVGARNCAHNPDLLLRRQPATGMIRRWRSR